MSDLIKNTHDGAALSLARWLVRCHPLQFREQYGTELDQVLRTLARFGVADGKEKFADYLWRTCIPDLCASMVRERFNEWEGNMKNNLGRLAGMVLIALWILYIGLSEARVFLHLPIKDPGNWLIGETPANWAYNSLNGFIILAPIIALVMFVAPYVHFSRGEVDGEVATIRLHKAAGVSRVLIVVTGLFSGIILFLLLFGRWL